jgi:cytochrome c oxidase subunit 3
MSAFSVQWAVYAARRQDGRNAAIAMLLTLVLGVAMANLEWLSFTRTHFGVRSHPYGTLYYLLIGYHLVHLVAAVAVGLILSLRTMAGHFSTDRHDPLRAGAVLWQYGNVVWFVVVTVLFLLSRHG